ncbi:MAG TPA: ATP-binding cassette domain-containing protein, partial [Candidatus Limnocylindrales bacterium]
GAGKTTTIRVLATLLRPTSGRARIAGHDVVREAPEVRRRVGFAMQSVALENLLTGRENLELIGRLHRVPTEHLRDRIAGLLELVALGDAADRLVGTYSGGMRRRLDLATALVHGPEVLFLDEPTEGLDPQSRGALWDELVRINRAGTTMLLTTHYMEEAERLCGRIAIIDEGRIVADGRPADLKLAVGGDTVTVGLAADGNGGLAHAQDEVIRLLAGFAPLTGIERTAGGLALSVLDARAAVPDLLRRLDGNGTHVTALAMTEPSLDDVFVRYTGKRIRPEAADRPLGLGWW